MALDKMIKEWKLQQCATKSVNGVAMVFRLDFTVLDGRLQAQVIRAD